MKLYYHPISTTSRPCMLMIAIAGLDVEMQVVDLFVGEHYQAPYVAVNPNRLVPVLEDGDFRLTESSAIVKYLAEVSDSPLYPKGLQARARVNERMDWVNTQLCRDLAYNLVYPQIFAFHKRESDEVQKATLQWGRERAQHWVKVLNDNVLGAGSNFVCGDSMTIADLYAAPFVHLGEVIGCDYAAQPNVRAWLGRMKALPAWGQVFEVIEGYSATLDRNAMVAL